MSLSIFMFFISTPAFVNLLRPHLFGTPVIYVWYVQFIKLLLYWVSDIIPVSLSSYQFYVLSTEHSSKDFYIFLGM